MENKFEKPKIGIDIDEIVAEFMKSYLEFHNEKYNTKILLDDIKCYHLWKCGIHPSKEEDMKTVGEFQESDYFDRIELVEGVKDALIKLNEVYSIHFITSRPEKVKEKTMLFLKNLFENFEFNLYFSDGPWNNSKTKGQICNELGIHIFVEDNPDYALDCAERGIKVFLMDKPWNQNYSQHVNIIKITGWTEILNALEIKYDNSNIL